jgi:hypothetical protein
MNIHHVLTWALCLGTVLGIGLCAGQVQAQYMVRPGTSPDLTGGTNPNVITPLQLPDPTRPYEYSGGVGGTYPTYPAYNYDFYGLQGAAQVIESQGKYMMDAEWARVIREQANQANLKTQKEKFDLQRYIEDNTPKWSDYQKKILAKRLERIREAATPGEIFSGSALNLLMNELGVKQFKKVEMGVIPPLSKEVLSHLNVTAPGNNGNMGLLREMALSLAKSEKGKEPALVWPIALRQILTDEDMKKVQGNTWQLLKVVAAGENGLNLYADLDLAVEKMREGLKAQVLMVPTDQYLEAKRFLNELRDAIRILQNPTAVKQYLDYQSFAAKDRTVTEVIDHIIRNGLAFAPATQGDEFAYQAMYSSLASYDVAFNMVIASVPKN